MTLVGLASRVAVCLASASLLMAAMPAQAGIAACYVGSMNADGIYSDQEYRLLKDGVSSGLALATMIRRHMRRQGVRQTPLCTYADGDGHYVLASQTDTRTRTTIYALGLSRRDGPEAEADSRRLVTTRRHDPSAQAEYRVIERGDFGLIDDARIKVHCSVDKSAVIEATFEERGHVLSGRFRVVGTTLTMNHGRVSSEVRQEGAPRPADEAVDRMAARLVETACGDALRGALRRNLNRSMGGWLFRAGQRALRQGAGRCHSTDDCPPPAHDATMGSRG